MSLDWREDEGVQKAVLDLETALNKYEITLSKLSVWLPRPSEPMSLGTLYGIPLEGRER